MAMTREQSTHSTVSSLCLSVYRVTNVKRVRPFHVEVLREQFGNEAFQKIEIEEKFETLLF